MNARHLVLLLLLLPIAAAISLNAEPEKGAEPVPPAKTMTREETVTYLVSQRKNIIRIPRADRTESKSDKRREKVDAILSIIPNDQIDLILKEAIEVSNVSQVPIATRAPYLSHLRKREFSSNEKPVIIANLRAIPELVDIINRHHWCKAASQEILVTTMAPEINPPAFVSALLEIDTPEARSLLPELLKQGSTSTLAVSYNRLLKQTDSDLITRLPAGDRPFLDMPAIVKSAWISARFRFNDDPVFYAPIAACYGHRDALIVMAKRIFCERDGRNEIENKFLHTVGNMLKNLVPLENKSPEEIARFVFTNRDKLVFDEAAGTYSLPK